MYFRESCVDAYLSVMVIFLASS